ncbi:MAG: hypothetical protein M3R59_04490 [Verrucomicrobiota bacterium]|nr:hypothetical protein [Verrucomicrobiota bacterium]MDQ2949900.1 hypothetical protein [Acidobacteriota bacterium]
MAALGDTFMLPKPGQETEHLWVLITNPNPATHEALMVNLTTQRPHSDTTTILNIGDHPFVQKPSAIFYADARIVDTQLLDAAVQRGACGTHASVQRPVIARIQAGIVTSPLTPRKIKTAYAVYNGAGLT